MSPAARWWILLFAALWSAGCGRSAAPVFSASCKPGEILLSLGGQFSCGVPPAIAVPLCTGQVLTSDGDSLGCVGQSASVAAAEAGIAQAVSSARQLATDVSNLGTGGQPPPMYRGTTPNKTAGKMTHAGADTGLAAARALCNDAFAGSHMCTVY